MLSQFSWSALVTQGVTQSLSAGSAFAEQAHACNTLARGQTAESRGAIRNWRDPRSDVDVEPSCCVGWGHGPSGVAGGLTIDCRAIPADIVLASCR